jgi:succinate dehydrogenase/fumarate reductase flavoprotein subunit
MDADVVVLGTGAAGLVAALAAAEHGATVALLEKGDVIGGTTALSGGTCWVPNNRTRCPISTRCHSG